MKVRAIASKLFRQLCKMENNHYNPWRWQLWNPSKFVYLWHLYRYKASRCKITMFYGQNYKNLTCVHAHKISKRKPFFVQLPACSIVFITNSRDGWDSLIICKSLQNTRAGMSRSSRILPRILSSDWPAVSLKQQLFKIWQWEEI